MLRPNHPTMSRFLYVILLLAFTGCAAELVETDADRINGRFSLTAVNDAPLPATVAASATNSIVVTEGSLFLDSVREFELQYRFTKAGRNELDLFSGKWSISEGKLTLRNEAGLVVFPENQASDSLIVLHSSYGGPEGVPFILRFER